MTRAAIVSSIVLGMVLGAVNSTHAAAVPTVTVGNVRVQLLSPTLVRIEKEGPNGTFEDRNTFTVVDRTSWAGTSHTTSTSGANTVIAFGDFRVELPTASTTVAGAKLYRGTTILYTVPAASTLESSALSKPRFPAPNSLGEVFPQADYPRYVPPAWGSTSMPAGALQTSDPLYATTGWDVSNNTAEDIYLFIKNSRTYTAVRQEVMQLTGKVPLLPLYAFGWIDSRFYPYSAQEALDTMDRYRSLGIPIDVFTCDMDWRRDTQTQRSYAVNTTLFPNMTDFVSKAHQKHIRITLNDHPVDMGGGPFDLGTFTFRYNGLTSLLQMGIDYWWFDANWDNIAPGPAGIDKETWGMKIFYDTHSRFRPGQRPFCMSIRSGFLGEWSDSRPVNSLHPAAHRYPVWWTGDLTQGWDELGGTIACTVQDAIYGLPYVSHDLGGFQDGEDLTPECYVRWTQWGAFMPTMRPHHSIPEECPTPYRYPWLFGANAQAIITAYIKLRYRLLPTIYAANRRTHEDGTPINRRLDWEFTESNATGNDEFLFTNDLLVKPTTAQNATVTSGPNVSVWVPPGVWENAWTGARTTGPASVSVASQLWHTPLFVRVPSIIMLAPDMQYSGEKPWDPVTLEVFPATARVVRELYEDDDTSVAYLDGSYTKTSIEATRTGETTQVNIGAVPAGKFAGQLANRSWLVRVHLQANDPVNSVYVNGAQVSLVTGTTNWRGAQAVARVLSPQASPSPVTASNFPMPFRGEGTSSGPNGGPVVEVWVPAKSTATTTTISVNGPPTSALAGNRPQTLLSVRFASAKGLRPVLLIDLPSPCPAGPVTVTTYDVFGHTMGRKTVVEATGGTHAVPLGTAGSGIRLVAVRAGKQQVILQRPQTSW